MKTITMTLLRETKGALRYVEGNNSDNPDQEGQLIGTLYLRKMAVGKITGGSFPQKIQVAIAILPVLLFLLTGCGFKKYTDPENGAVCYYRTLSDKLSCVVPSVPRLPSIRAVP
jgi:hypothetical protein